MTGKIKKYRIGIDVGGTFTDAVVINGETFEFVAKKKILTTHKEGVAIGIIRIIHSVLDEAGIDPENVTFIAHGTTQATNALLEGDVASVGIIGMGTGVDARRARNETNISQIELSPGKFLKAFHRFIDSSEINPKIAEDAIKSLIDEGVQVILATEAFSVDNPKNEIMVRDTASQLGYYATMGHEVSQLYGLKIRTRTALINASLVPRMIETADMTEQAVKDANIPSRLMIMRCDGGVMSVDEVRKRPIMTLLSGLAAGVAGALMGEKVSDGIFFEVGGTSTDISVIKNGRVMVKYSQVGGHKTYLRSVDVRTIGIAGGTMIKVRNKKIIDVGPRSAHIAGINYECFAPDFKHMNCNIHFISPKESDPAEYVVVRSQSGETYSLTLTGAANLLGYVQEGDYAKGNIDATRIAWQALADHLGDNITAAEAAKQALNIALDKVMAIVSELIGEYDIDRSFVSLVGGGGGAGVIIPALGEREKMNWRIVKEAPYISTIGVALAMVREQVERTIVNPSDEDIARIRENAIEKAVRAGACESTVDVTIEIDPLLSLVRAVATGATELRTKERGAACVEPEQMRLTAANALNVPPESVLPKMSTGRWTLFESIQKGKKFFGMITVTNNAVCIIDRENVVRFKRKKTKYLCFSKGKLDTMFTSFLDENTYYSDANATLPAVFLFFREKMLDLSGIQVRDQLISILCMEIRLLDDKENIIAVAYSNR